MMTLRVVLALNDEDNLDSAESKETPIGYGNVFKSFK